MTISKSTVRVNIFSDVYSVLNNNVVDPLGRGKQWIFTSLPDTLKLNFVGYPILVINKARIKKTREVFDDSYSDKGTPVIVTVYTTNNEDNDTLSDSVDDVMTPKNFPQFDFKDYNESDGSTDLGSGLVYFRTMTYSVELMNIE